MTLEEIKAWLEANKANSDVQTYLGELSAPTVQGVEGFLDTPEGKKVLQPRLDSNFTTGLNTWKKNNLEKLVEEEVKKRNPDKTPEQLELEKLRNEIEQDRKERLKLELTNKAISTAAEKGLTLDKKILDRLIADDEENTLANLDALEAFAKAQYQAGVDNVYKTGGRDVGGTGGGKGGESDSYGKKLAEAVKAQTPADLETQKAGFFK